LTCPYIKTREAHRAACKWRGIVPRQHGFALLLVSQLEGLRHIQPGILVLAVQAVAAHWAMPGRDFTMHNVPNVCP